MLPTGTMTITKTMKTIEFHKVNGTVSNIGELHSWLDRNVKYLRNGTFTIQIVGKRRCRTLAQNRLMWMWFACIECETGQTANDIHDYYCEKYLRHEVTNPATGEIMSVAGHTSCLSVEQFTRFLNDVQADAATELGITLPTPDEEGWEEFEDEYKKFV